MTYFLIVLFVLIGGGIFLWKVCTSHDDHDGDAILQSFIGLVIHVGANVLFALVLFLDRNLTPAVYAGAQDEDPRPWFVLVSIIVFIIAAKVAGPPTKTENSNKKTK